ncbi:PREDICTED: putative protein TPRXL [Papilio polytes]|uniref:putative protein TPRXL n=1 Tax=Papilio polytes TaxID=76194 RepID=UPI0006763D13|nr:PREDICTED: putative protein TPRXL [Papilio polytes]
MITSKELLNKRFKSEHSQDYHKHSKVGATANFRGTDVEVVGIKLLDCRTCRTQSHISHEKRGDYPRPQQIYHQPIPTYSQPQAQPSFTYAPQFPVEPIRPLPAFVAPQQYSPITQQFSSGQGYAYQQPQSSSFVSQLPLQSQSFSNFPASSLSSYQADSNQYNTAAQSQTHSEVLDSTVVNRVQNIIKDNEHTSAKEAGLLSLVSGVSLENARPSVEITSFVQNSAAPNRVIDTSSYSSSSSSSAGASSPSASLLPSFTSNIQPQQSTGAISLSFLPHTQPATSYGPPN